MWAQSKQPTQRQITKIFGGTPVTTQLTQTTQLTWTAQQAGQRDNNKREATCRYETPLTTKLLIRLRSNCDAWHRLWGVFRNQLALRAQSSFRIKARTPSREGTNSSSASSGVGLFCSTDRMTQVSHSHIDPYRHQR